MEAYLKRFHYDLILHSPKLTRTLIDMVGVERVACGHLHRSIQVRWAGTVAMTVPATAQPVDLDVRNDGGLAYYGYGVETNEGYVFGAYVFGSTPSTSTGTPAPPTTSTPPTTASSAAAATVGPTKG